jgi:adenine-specific DNA-methyltransferase
VIAVILLILGELSADQLSQQLDLHTDHINPYATQEEILYELLLKAGFMPTEKVETLDLAGKQVFSIAAGALLICLEDELTAELIDAVADLEPMQFICLDKAFNGND